MILNFFDVECTGVPDKEPFISDPTLGPEITEYALATWNDGNVTDVVHKLVMPQHWRDPLVATCDEEGTVRTPDGFPRRPSTGTSRMTNSCTAACPWP